MKAWFNGREMLYFLGRNRKKGSKYDTTVALGIYSEIYDERVLYFDNILISKFSQNHDLDEWGTLPNGSVLSCESCQEAD